MQSKKRFRLAFGASLVAASAALTVFSPARAQDSTSTTSVTSPRTRAAENAPGANTGAKGRSEKRPYYIDFRARTAASYGHAFIWYGRVGQKAVEVAGLHPATESVIPYILGHVLPVPSETGKSYGDLDEEYLTASYRVYLTEAEAQRAFAYIKDLQANSPLWNAAVYNCVAFIRDIAQYIGLRTPGSHLLYPEDWVNELRALNSGSRAAQAKPTAPPPNQARAAVTPPTQASAAVKPPAQAETVVTQSIY